MKNILRFLLRDSRFTAFHLFAIALFLLGTFVILTATELGAFAPLLVSGGIYLAFFSLFLEGVFWLKVLGRRLCRSWIAA